MTATSGQQWKELNQQYLSAAVAAVRSHLDRHAAKATNHTDSEVTDQQLLAARERCADISSRISTPPAIDGLSALFGLSPFERDVLVLCAGMELDAAFGASAAAAHGDPQRTYPTFSLALAALPQPHWSALLPTAPLRHWHLIEFAQSAGSAGSPLTTRPLRVDERVLHCLSGIQHLDDRLEGFVTRIRPPKELMPTHQRIVSGIVRTWSSVDRRSQFPALALHGPDRLSARLIAASACQSIGLVLHCLNAYAIPSNPSDLHLFTRLWKREALLSASAVLIDCEDTDFNQSQEASTNEFIERMTGPLIVVSRQQRRIENRSAVTFEISRLGGNDQRKAWTAVLPESVQQASAKLDLLISQFSLNTAEIYAAAAEVGVAEGAASSVEDLWDACRKQTRSQLEGLAQRIECNASWDDVVLPDAQKEILREIVAQVRHRSTVHEAWGFAGKSNRGLGINALFAGSSGTGKTMAAEVLAGALRLDLYRIDLSSVVSKYIGETEKNLSRVFDAAEAGGAILLFDEADALFGKRSEVKDSHDRYANVEVSYLLQRMENYRGLAILTTNMKSALDVAFLRRIRFIVHFQFPDVAQRAQIWRKVFPKEAPTQALDHDRLAQLNVSGGNIRNIALSAAFLAADMNEPIGMSHLLRAARSEYAKLEKPLTDLEIADWIENDIVRA